MKTEKELVQEDFRAGLRMADRIEWVMRERSETIGGSAAEWCRRAHMNPSQVSSMIGRLRDTTRETPFSPEVSTMARLAYVAGISPAWFAYGIGSPLNGVLPEGLSINLGAAIGMAMLAGQEFDPRTIEHFLSAPYSMPSDQDVRWWYSEIEKYDAKIRINPNPSPGSPPVGPAPTRTRDDVRAHEKDLLDKTRTTEPEKLRGRPDVDPHRDTHPTSGPYRTGGRSRRGR